MRIYLASPNNQMQAASARDMPVLLSYAMRKTTGKWIERYIPSFSHLLIDSGAYSELTTGQKIDGHAYVDWVDKWCVMADAVAGLDDISGDWKRSLRNYEQFGGFPTYHDTDPPELLDDLLPIAYERGNWLGIGLLPPRTGREEWLLRTLDRIPNDIHLHGWALRRYAHLRRFDSMDSTNWWRDALQLFPSHDPKKVECCISYLTRHLSLVALNDNFKKFSWCQMSNFFHGRQLQCVSPPRS